jgi:hypothetical protein
MPKISEFYGIAIYVYYREHLPPHFHARYGESEVLVAIGDLSVLRGRIPPRALGLVMEWAGRYQRELLHVWSQAQAHQPLDTIEPLN